MAKRKQPQLDPKEQIKRFKETAKAIEADETGQHFEKAIDLVIPPSAPKPQARGKRR